MRICQRLKIVIVTPVVYPRFLNFFTLTFRALGTHCHDLGDDSRMTSSEIECAQLHSELFRRRHTTRQSHGLFALAKPLYYLDQGRRQAVQGGVLDQNVVRVCHRLCLIVANWHNTTQQFYTYDHSDDDSCDNAWRKRCKCTKYTFKFMWQQT